MSGGVDSRVWARIDVGFEWRDCDTLCDVGPAGGTPMASLVRLDNFIHLALNTLFAPRVM